MTGSIEGVGADAVRSPGRRSIVAGLVGGLVVLVLGCIRIGRSFGYDEAFTYHFFINGGSVKRALTTQIVFNNHPMFSAIQSVAWRAGLVGESSQRLGPVVCGAVTVAIVVWFTSRRAGVIAGFGAGIVLALNPVFFNQFRQLRGYSLATMSVTVAAVALWMSCSDRRRRWLVLQGVFMVIAVTAHAYSAVTILMLAVAAIALRRVRVAHIVTWGASAIVALLISSPLLDDMRKNASARGTRFWDSFPLHLTRALTGWEWVPVVLTLTIVGVGIVVVGRTSRRHAIALLLSGGVFVSVVALLWLVIQPFDLYFRFFMSVLPLIAVMAGIGLGRIPIVGRVAVIVVLVVSLIPHVGDILDDSPTIREAAAVTDRARDAGYEVCGRHAEPLAVYTPPVRLVAGITDFESCEVYVSVLRMSAEQRRAASERFGGRQNLGGGIVIWANPDVLDDVLDDVVGAGP